MATPTNTPLADDVWDLSIDDLLALMPEIVRLGGSGPFVINLSASSAPISLPTERIAASPHAHVYRVQRTEDGRLRYRLRVGPFASEDEVDAILPMVREVYPGALTATADSEDLRILAMMQTKADALQSTMQKPAAKAVEKPAEKFAERPAERPAETAAQRAPEMPAEKKAAVSTDVSNVARPNAPTPGAKPAAITPRAPQAVAAAPAPRQGSAARQDPAPRQGSAARQDSAPRQGSAARQVEQLSKPLPSLDATQTMRALTQPELEDDQASRWFAIQLAVAEEAFDPDAVANLDIFSVYRLYSVAGIDQGRIVHALRLGFFSEEGAAAAVASYVAPYYDKPRIKRVSAAERERFADQRLRPRKDVGATGKHSVIEITSERFVRERRNAAPEVLVSQKGR